MYTYLAVYISYRSETNTTRRRMDEDSVALTDTCLSVEPEPGSGVDHRTRNGHLCADPK